MSRGHERWALFVAIFLCGAPVSNAVTVGQPLAAALQELRAAGLQLIFSSALIEPGDTVEADPGTGTPEQLARRILAPHGLALEAVRPGLFAVVRVPAAGASANAASVPNPEPRRPRQLEPLPEVSVYASRYSIEAQPNNTLAQFSREDLDVLPGLNEDVLRVTHYLPGTASNSVSARTHVRGGREDELAVFFDGVPLFEPFHFKDVQSLFGIVDPESISTVDFYSGVFPARYGNRLSGVLNIEPRQWEGTNHHAIGASLLYTHVLTQGRLDSHPIEWLASVRRGNVDLIAKALGRDEVEPDFVDALGRIQLGLGERTSLALGGLLLDDTLEINLGDERARIDYRDTTGWLTWQLKPDDGGREFRATVSRTERHTSRVGSVDQIGNANGSVADHRQFDTTTARAQAAVPVNQRMRLSGGFEAYDYGAHYDYSSELALDPVLAAVFGQPVAISRVENLPVDGEAYAAYLSALVSLTSRTKLELGARWDGQRFGAAFRSDQLSPRLSFQFERDPATVLRLSWGQLSQTERPDELAVQDGDRSFHSAERARQAVVSLERRSSRSLLWRIEAFHKEITDPLPAYENLFDPFALLPELAADRVRVAPDGARASGAELSLRWELPPRWLGWASYSWSQVSDRFGQRSVPRTWDQRHSMNTGLNWNRSPWGLSGNVMWHTGWRSNELRIGSGSDVMLIPRNTRVWPDYFTLDLRGTWSRPLPRGTLQVFAEISNVANHANPCCSAYSVNESPGKIAVSREISPWLPRIYSLGVNWQLP